MQPHELKGFGFVCLVAIFITLLALFAAWTAGARMQMAKVIQLCEQGGKFYRLDAAGDTPYRCTRVIDYPPSTTEGSTP